MEMVILSGCQGAGKTTFYMTTFLHTHVRISLDMLGTRRREALFAKACIAMRQRFVVDNTNPTRNDRAKYIEWARGSTFRVLGYHFDATIGSLLARNARRGGKARVPDSVILATRRRLEMPSIAEGFDMLFRVDAQDDGTFYVEEYRKE